MLGRVVRRPPPIILLHPADAPSQFCQLASHCETSTSTSSCSLPSATRLSSSSSDIGIRRCGQFSFTCSLTVADITKIWKNPQPHGFRSCEGWVAAGGSHRSFSSSGIPSGRSRQHRMSGVGSSGVIAMEASRRLAESQTRMSPCAFRVGQYNILAGYLGSNKEPWFLYGTDLTAERRQEIFALFYERLPDGRLANAGWPNYVQGILTDEEIHAVETIDKEFFAWEKRKQLLLERIGEMNADIISIVECDNYEEHFQPGLARLGYDSLWRKRPRERTLDGCCIAWQKDKFQLLAHSAVEYVDKFDPSTGDVKKDRIAVIALLKINLSGECICFVSTHLARNPELVEVDRLRARQIGQVVRAIASFVQEHDALDAPVVLTGDLNATSFNKLRGIAAAVALLKEDTYVHPFAFDCKDVPSGPTSCTMCREMRIDALMYQGGCLEVVDVPETTELGRPIPDAVEPSDHVPITATFRRKTKLEIAQSVAKEWFLRLAGEGAKMPLSIEGLRDGFKLYDVNGSGVVSEPELRKVVLSIMGDTATAEQIDMGLAKLPKDGVDFEAFVRAHREATVKAGMPGLEDFRDAFQVFDKDHDGAISLDELLAIFTECSPAEVPREELVLLFSHIDVNQDGLIDEVEFLSHLNYVWTSQFKLPCDARH